MSAARPDHGMIDLLRGQRYAVLATVHDGFPYASLVAVAASSDCRTIYFATLADTRKARALAGNSRVAMLVDNRRNEADDLAHAAALTVTGVARVLEGKARDEAKRVYLGVHPRLAGFVERPACRLFACEIEAWYLSSRFETSA